MNCNTLIIDGSYLAQRSFKAPYHLTTTDGRDATLIHSFIRTLNSLHKQLTPKHIVIAWESPGTPSQRRLQYSAYKSQRTANPEYISELKDLQKLLYLFGIPQYNSSGNEADDVIAKLVGSEKIVVFTTDKDLMQLVSDNCQVYDGKTFYDTAKVKEKFGVLPSQIPDLLAIAGDKADNIEGISGYSIKKSAKILREFGNVESIPFPICSSNMHLSLPMQEKILRNKRLTLLRYNCELEKVPKEDVKETIEDILDKYELKSIKEKIEEYKFSGDARQGG